MRSKLIILVVSLILCLSNLLGQSGEIPCGLSNMYRITVDKSPVFQRQNIQLRITEVNKKSASSLFDYQLFSDLSVNRLGNRLFDLDPRQVVVGQNINTNQLSLSGGVQRNFRSGLSAEAGITYSRIADNFPFNSFNEDVGSFYSDNATNVFVSIRQPLIRGKGRDITTANEAIADHNIESQGYNTSFVSSGEILNMAIRYWQYLGATESLEVYRLNQDRVEKVLDITNELIIGNKNPQSDILQIQADLKDKERQTIQARQQLFTTRQNLGLQVGLNTVDSDLIGVPTDKFPDIDDVPADLNLQTLLEMAHQNRSDIKSIKKSLDALSINIDVAENNTKPSLDVLATVNYGGVDGGNGLHQILSALGRSEGRNYQLGLGLSYLFPVNNNNAEANLLNSQLRYRDQEVLLNNQIRNIEVNVSVAYNNLLASIEAVKKSKQSLLYYEEVFENEQYKFQTGLTTLLNLILFQERLTFAQLDYIQSQQQFAIAISNLRFETGTIFFPTNIESSNQGTDFSKIFYSLPTN